MKEFKRDIYRRVHSLPTPPSGCTEYTLTVVQSDIDASDDGIVYWDFPRCDNAEIETRQHTVVGTYVTCVRGEAIPIVYIYVGTVLTVAVDSTVVNSGECE